MKKDNFDLKAYLVENKMTENSRGEARHHFGEAKLDTRILTEGYDSSFNEEEGQFIIVPVDSAKSVEEVSESEESGDLKGEFLDCVSALPIDADDEEGVYEEDFAGHSVRVLNSWGAWDRFTGYATIKIDGKGLNEYGDDDPIFKELIPAMVAKYGKLDDQGNIVDADGNVLDECGDVPSQPADGVVDECDAIRADLDEMDQELDEAGYTDEDDPFSDPDADAAVANAFRDRGAKRAFDRDVAKDAEVKDFDADMENDPTDPAADLDDEEGEDEPVDGNAAPVAGGITVNDLIPGEGKRVEEMRANTEILVDLKDFFDEHPTYKLATLQRFIRNGFRAIKEYGYKEVLLKPQAIGYDINNRRVEDAIVRLTRPESVSQYGNSEK